MEAKKGLWKFLICLDNDSDKIWNQGVYYNSKEEAIEAGAVEYNYCSNFIGSESEYSSLLGDEKAVSSQLVLLVGEIEGITADVAVNGVNAESILDGIAENMEDEFGEVATDYLVDVTEEHDSILEQRLKEVVKQWMVDFGYSPQFSLVKNIEKVLPSGSST